tara:strand:- start:135 stop:806 length:672 start_codon:yes stop_codon:yes gene_type:complete
MIKTHKIKYDTSAYPFRPLIKKILGENSLENLHEVKKYERYTEPTDQATMWHKTYYDKFETEFYPLYKTFIEEFVKPQYIHLEGVPVFDLDAYNEIIYQKIPTFRVHQVDNLGVGEWHRDRDYNHGVDEINLWLPFTDAYGTNTIWMESEEGKEDFKGYDVSYGEILVFSGPNLLHGNQTNIEKDSRCSIDFRIVHPDKFKTSEEGSVTANVKFKVGGYFEKI